MVNVAIIIVEDGRTFYNFMCEEIAAICDDLNADNDGVLDCEFIHLLGDEDIIHAIDDHKNQAIFMIFDILMTHNNKVYEIDKIVDEIWNAESYRHIPLIVFSAYQHELYSDEKRPYAIKIPRGVNDTSIKFRPWDKFDKAVEKVLRQFKEKARKLS